MSDSYDNKTTVKSHFKKVWIATAVIVYKMAHMFAAHSATGYYNWRHNHTAMSLSDNYRDLAPLNWCIDAPVQEMT